LKNGDKMITIPVQESKHFPEFKGLDILEFGNKRSKKGLYKDEYLYNGASSYVSIDINAQDGAIPVDLREFSAPDIIIEKTKKEKYDLIVNIGTSEHVTSQQTFWYTVHQLSKKGTYQVHCVPKAEKHLDHANAGSCWHPYPEFFQKLAELNNYKIDYFEVTPAQELMNKKERRWGDLIFCRYIVLEDNKTFTWNKELDSLFWKNTNYKESDWVYKL